jgi:DNA-directed RNA polymerase subunit K/omega
MNKYEMVLIAAREARRINEVARMHGRELKVRPTVASWERLLSGKIKYTYEAEQPAPPPEDLVPEETA